MIAKLTGVLDSTGEDWVVIDTNGVGYLIFCSTRTLINFPSRGEIVSLIIETHIREDHIHLYGFLDQAERDWFRLLTSVQGVGAKVGLGILSVLSPAELSDAILSEDKGMITRAPGVGPKLATRLLSELKDKTGGLPGFASPSATASAASGKGADSAAFDDAVSALVNLGYQRSAAFSAVSSAINTSSEAAPVEDLIRAGLRELSG
ncbi:MAG: Holliday junction branch migration protein RuvA [Pseudomonadota bacterium]|nr:Holliday junction branch migration protein RuvA [Pseudomonadota bacterium]MEC8463954.1 Holliday junction branch migration protein RuvA [Pseudomonadota bacterium]MEC8725410.1 Holliday junction branch migration protein RuvA [Pseudomonadota bacterium]